MTDDWLAFLTDEGAHLKEGHVEHFGTPDQEPGLAVDADILVDLSHFGLISAAGEDASAFLQGQLTNDVRKVSEEHSQLSAYCSPKGRILADFRLFKRDGTFYLRMPQELLQPTLERLRKYVLMSKVTLEDASPSLARMGLSGPNAERLLGSGLRSVPTAPDDVIQAAGLTVLRVPGPHPRFEIYGTAQQLKELWQRFSPHANPVGADAWALLDIRGGIPTIYSATSEAFVPQMVNLHLTEGVSFRKGCYPGQEVVARMQYLGKLKRRMYLAHVPGPTRPMPGDELYSSHTESGQGTGKVVDARPAPEEGYDLLAVVQIATMEAAESVRLGDAEGPLLNLRDLPYTFEEAESVPEPGGLSTE